MQHTARTLDESPLGRLASIQTSNLVIKRDAPNAGDHTPSISSVNKTPDKVLAISGRNSNKGQYDEVVGQRYVPTFQFNTNDFYDRSGKRSTLKGSAAHTMYTSLREMHGVGETHKVKTHSDLLDKTKDAYSSYNSSGDFFRSKVVPYRVNIHAESNKGPVLHKSKTGVEPLVGQAIINLHYRDPQFFGFTGHQHHSSTNTHSDSESTNSKKRKRSDNTQHDTVKKRRLK
ncbi:hypothetical protein [Alteromonas sp. a30]|uniref:hypothetical protein n=1 Tax=Alteromonas sp. a30 TaxID=2730917 RepID=UPI00227EA506|nr:hypothetical protein [Alteromonas sp. a30]MCY7297224.1 hypothetical protein [Alteromonas sp. a30]